MKKAFFALLAVILTTIIPVPQLFAQQSVRLCGTVEYNRQKEQNNQAISEARQRYNHLVQQQMDLNSAGSNRSVITIPVVVHVIYNINIQNISNEQVISQIDVLNKDFGRTNSDTALTPQEFDSVAVNTGIQFCLATQTPDGQPTNGIERRQNTSVITWSNNDEMKSYVTGGLDAWDRSRYLNIWVCTLANNYLGYTQLPGNPDSLNDGVVITSRAFGSTGFVSPPFHLGRTATHEVGHWLGLNHVWGDDGGACPWDPGGNDDGIADTPPQGSETTGCPLFPAFDNCSTVMPGIMFMNYMDYTDDACMNMFTAGQTAKMMSTIQVHRPGLFTSDGCGPIGISEIDKDNIVLYPNPAFNELSIKNSKSGIEMLEVYDFLGRGLLRKKPMSGSQLLSVDVSSLDAGTYFLKITYHNSVSAARFTVTR